MSYDVPPSPVAPQAGSRLWTAGAGAGVAVVVLLGLAVWRPELAWPLLGGALLVVAATYALLALAADLLNAMLDPRIRV